MYSVSDLGWKTFNIDALSKEQCSVAEKLCKDGAFYERVYAIAIGASALTAATAVVFIAIEISILAPVIFTAYLGKTIATFGGTLPHLVPIGNFLVIGGLSYLFSLVALRRLWDASTDAFNNHWSYAKHLDAQAIDMALKKPTLESSEKTS